MVISNSSAEVHYHILSRWEDDDGKPLKELLCYLPHGPLKLWIKYLTEYVNAKNLSEIYQAIKHVSRHLSSEQFQLFMAKNMDIFFRHGLLKTASLPENVHDNFYTVKLQEGELNTTAYILRPELPYRRFKQLLNGIEESDVSKLDMKNPFKSILMGDSSNLTFRDGDYFFDNKDLLIEQINDNRDLKDNTRTDINKGCYSIYKYGLEGIGKALFDCNERDARKKVQKLKSNHEDIVWLLEVKNMKRPKYQVDFDKLNELAKRVPELKVASLKTLMKTRPNFPNDC